MNHRMRTDFLLALRTWGRSWNFIFSNGLSVYFLYPVLISILLSMGAVALIRQGVRSLMAHISPWLGETAAVAPDSWDTFRNVILNFAEYAIAFVLWIAAFYTFIKISKYLLLALMSPVMALLSERTEEILTGKSYPFDLFQFLRDVLRGTAIAVRNLFAELTLGWVLIAVQLAAAIIFPPSALILAPLLPVVSFAIGAYFYGFSTLDYILERRRMSIPASIRTIREMKGLAAGNGSVFALLSYVPFIGVTVATITCTVAAMLAVHERDLQKEKKTNTAGPAGIIGQ
jgi:CysZ protein